MAAVLQMYAYKAKDADGRVRTGKMEGDSAIAVRDTLRTRGATPIDIAPTNASIWTRDFSFTKKKKVKLKDLSAMTRQFSVMLNSGLPLLRALDILSVQTTSEELRRAVKAVRNDVEGGSSLSDSMSKHPDAFPSLMVNLARAGETGGFLDEAMLRISTTFEGDVKLRSKIKSAMTYPTVVAGFSVLLLIAVLLFIVPIFEGLYADLGGELPMATQMLVNVSNVFKNGLPLIILGTVAAGWWWQRNKNRNAVREVVDPMKLRMPVFGPLFQKVAMSRFSRNFSTLLHAGVPVLNALDVVADTTGSVVIARAVRDVQSSVRDGDSIAEPLTNYPVFPPMVVQMIAVGEDTGAVDELLEKVADFYDHEVEQTTAALTSLIEPLLVVALGAIIGAMVFALYWPVFSIFDLIK